MTNANRLAQNERHKILLNRLYPDKIVFALSQQQSLYQEIRTYARENQLSIKDYLASLGFEYVRKNSKVQYTIDEAIDKLNSLFPDKAIESLELIINEYPDLYHSIRAFARTVNKTPYEIIGEKGFLYLPKFYDVSSIGKLKEEFDFSLAEFGNWFNVSRQNIDQVLKKSKRTYVPIWQNKVLSEQDIVYIRTLIDEKKTIYENAEKKTVVKIYKDKASKKVAIFVKNNDDIKCIFDVPDDINTELISNGFHKYSDTDFELIREINQKSDLVDITNDGALKVKIRDKKIMTKISNAMRSRKNSEYGADIYQYIKFLGFEKDENEYRHRISEEEIIETLKRYRIDNSNTIRIPINDPEYQRIHSLVHNRGFNTIRDFVQSFGFDYKRFRTTNILSEYKETITKHYIVYDDKIYINSTDPLYANLTQYANRNDIKLDELIKSIGFIRLKRGDLPENYMPFNWEKYERKRVASEDLISLLDERANENNQVYINSYEPLYDKLFLISRRNNMTINEYLSQLGYERIYSNYSQNESRPFHWIEDNSDEEKQFIQKTLEEVKSIQGSLNKCKTNSDSMQRSRELAKVMKKLYKYRCQLCSPDETGFSSPLILMEDDKFYVELHHIVPVYLRDIVSDDSGEKLDTYENVVIVCPHHHKYLHYHQGGFGQILKNQDGTIFFKSQNGEILEVFTDYHLKLRKDIEQFTLEME